MSVNSVERLFEPEYEPLPRLPGSRTTQPATTQRATIGRVAAIAARGRETALTTRVASEPLDATGGTGAAGADPAVAVEAYAGGGQQPQGDVLAARAFLNGGPIVLPLRQTETPAVAAAPAPTVTTAPPAPPTAADVLARAGSALGADWAQQRQSVMGQVRADYEAARRAAEAAGQFQHTETQYGESGSYDVVVFDDAAFRADWEAKAGASLQPLASLYGTDPAGLVGGRRDVIELALRGNVGLYEGWAPEGHVMASAEEIDGLDAYLSSPMNQVLIREYGTAPVEAPTSGLAQEQVRRYGRERYELLARLEQAQAHIQADYAHALEAARHDPGAAGWHDVQVAVEVGGMADESGRCMVPPDTVMETRRVFDVEAFSTWYVQQPQISNQAFGAMYGVGREVVVTPETTDESGHPIPEQREVHFQIRLGDGSSKELALQGDRVVDPELVHIDLNRPPDLHDANGVFWHPLLGWTTHNSNIDHGSDWFDSFFTIVVIAVACYFTAGAAAGAFGGMATLGGAIAGGAAAGATAAAVGGMINGNFSWDAVLKGAVLGGVGGAATFGVSQLAQAAADAQLAANVQAAGGSVTELSPISTPLAQQTVRSSYEIGANVVIDGLDDAVQSQLVADAQQTFQVVRTGGQIVQGGAMAELGGGDFDDGAFGAFGSVLGQRAGGVVSSALDGTVDPGIARFAGGVAGAGVTGAVVNARGGDGDLTFLNGVVDTAVSYLPPVDGGNRNGGTTPEAARRRAATMGLVGVDEPVPPFSTADGAPRGNFTVLNTGTGDEFDVAPTEPYARIGDVQSAMYGTQQLSSVVGQGLPSAGDTSSDAHTDDWQDPQAAFRASERAYRDRTEDSVAGRSHQARAGDSISRILGTSDPQAVGAFMRANDLGSTTLQVGRTYFVPDDVGAYGDAGGLGQAALNHDNARLAVLAEQRAAQQQAQWDAMRTGAWSGRTGDGVPVWHGSEGTAPIAPGAAAPASPGGRYEAVPDYDAMGMPTGGTQQVWVSDQPPMSYADQMRHALPAAVDLMVVGPIKGVINGVPEALTAAAKGWIYIGAATRDGFDWLTGSPSQDYLGRAIQAWDSTTGRIVDYANGFERMGGFVGEMASPFAYGRAVQATATGVTDAAAALRELGVPDWNIRLAPPGTLYANGVGLEFERIGVRVAPEASGSRLIVMNREGVFYPEVPDPRTGRSIPFPDGDLARVPMSDRASWNRANDRYAYIKEWYERGYETPRGGWAEYDIHHIRPREFGGDNSFWNLVPVQRQTHQNLFNQFWNKY